jgi:2,4-dienoyl-CoA reductase (NADPH2)
MRNRVVMSPMSVCYGNTDGVITARMIEHYARRASGGAGMVITENLAVSASGRQLPRQSLISADAQLPGLAALAAAIRREGALAVAQIVHAGRYAGPWEDYERERRLAPSAVEFELLPGRRVTPSEITVAEIDETRAAFANATRLAREAGFDGVEIHGAQGMLISSFHSPRMNRRTDGYGTDRNRFTREVVADVMQSAAGELIVGFHLSSDEMIDGGFTPAAAVITARQLEALGVDFLIPIPTTFESLRTRRAIEPHVDPTRYSPGTAAALARAVNTPIFANGGLSDARDAVAVLEAGDCAAVALARALFADPDWPRKALAGISPRECDCTPMTCLRTQMTGAVCHSWPQPELARGFWGMDDQRTNAQPGGES